MGDKRVIIEHADGRRYSVTQRAFGRLYEGEGFKVVGSEQPSDFTADVPRPKRRQGARRKSTKVIPATPTEDVGADG